MFVKRSERGWPGHFICSNRCNFRRNTLLEYGDIKIVISTVGNMQHIAGKPEKTGTNCYYETMVFHADKYDLMYHDADVDKQVYFNSPWHIDKLYHGVDVDADIQHENVVNEITENLLKGERYDESE
jgi:hypothetical protein